MKNVVAIAMADSLGRNHRQLMLFFHACVVNLSGTVDNRRLSSKNHEVMVHGQMWKDEYGAVDRDGKRRVPVMDDFDVARELTELGLCVFGRKKWQNIDTTKPHECYEVSLTDFGFDVCNELFKLRCNRPVGQAEIEREVSDPPEGAGADAPGVDSLASWDPESDNSGSAKKVGLRNPNGYTWFAEQDQGDGGTSYFQLFKIKPWRKVLSIYPRYDDGGRRGVEIRGEHNWGVVIGEALTIKEAGKIVEKWVKDNRAQLEGV